MIKKNNNLNIYLPSINLYEKDIFNIIKILNNNNLKNMVFKIEEYKTNDINDFLYNGVINNLIIEVIAELPKNNFTINLNQKGSFITYFEEIDNLNLGILLHIEDFIKTKKTIFIPRKTLVYINVIVHLFLMYYIFFYFNKSNLSLIGNIISSFGFLLYIDFYYIFNKSSMSKIIFKINNRFKRFYFNHYYIYNFLIFLIFNFIYIILAILSYFYDFTLLGIKF